METKKKSVSEYVQEYGALIALIVLCGNRYCKSGIPHME